MELTRERKYILIAGAILLACGVVYRFYPVLIEAFSVEEELAVKQAQIHKYQATIAKKRGLQRTKEALEKRLRTLEKSLLTGNTPSLAAVNLQEFIKQVAGAEAIEIDSMRVMSARQEEGSSYTLVPVRFVINSNIRQLKNLLFQIESAPRLLIIRELRVDSKAERIPGKIRTTMTVEGVMAGSGSPEKTG